MCYHLIMIKLLCIFLNIFLAVSSSHSSHQELGSVILSHILYRHGDRTPIDPYPKDPYRNESDWPVPFAQLTPVGMHQHLQLGRWLRDRYRDFLPETYSVKDIYVRSTDVDRTLMSAEANLAGLYPPKAKQIWDLANWMPIPVHTVPEHLDSLLSAKKPCPRYNFELNKLKNSPKFKKIDEENAKLYDYLTENTGSEINSLLKLEYLYSNLLIESLYNKTLPNWTKSVFPNKLEPLARLSFMTDAYNKILQRLKSGSLLGEMLDHMVLKSKGFLLPNRKIFVYSAHDETIANFLMTLQLFDPHCPPYASAVLVELRKNVAGQHTVTVFYKNSSAEPTLLTIPGCTAACPLDDFERLTEDVIPNDLERECQMNHEDLSINISMTVIIAVLSTAILMLIVVVMLILLVVYWHYKHNYRQYYLRLSTDPI